VSFSFHPFFSFSLRTGAFALFSPSSSSCFSSSSSSPYSSSSSCFPGGSWIQLTPDYSGWESMNISWWQHLGMDLDSQYPPKPSALFNADTFQLDPGSPCFVTGFNNIDLSSVGPLDESLSRDLRLRVCNSSVLAQKWLFLNSSTSLELDTISSSYNPLSFWEGRCSLPFPPIDCLSSLAEILIPFLSPSYNSFQPSTIVPEEELFLGNSTPVLVNVVNMETKQCLSTAGIDIHGTTIPELHTCGTFNLGVSLFLFTHLLRCYPAYHPSVSASNVVLHTNLK
jgi:hypothetical protein